MFIILDRVLQHIVKKGALTVTDPNGTPHIYGDGTGEPVAFRITSQAWATKIGLDGNLRFGEAYMEGGLVPERGTIRDILSVIMYNVETYKYPKPLRSLGRMRILLKRLDQYNPIGKAQKNVAHHYDLSSGLYDLFLDSDRQYSCAYYNKPGISLEEAQLAKKRHIAAKLDIRPGMRVLDIGSGWGGLGLYLARHCGAHVVGVTLSQEQHSLSRKRARDEGLEDRADFRLQDYREINEPFDRIVSVGMFEHVGVGHYKEYFRKVSGLLKDDGVALIHSINRCDGPGATSAWVKKYIFPGGYVPALSEVLPIIERTGLYVTDIEILRLHYAQTLDEWYRRFAQNRDKAKAIYDERFCRLWEFYLAGSEMAFRHAGMNNFQIQMVKDQHRLPLTRDYIAAREAELRLKDERALALPMVEALPPMPNPQSL